MNQTERKSFADLGIPFPLYAAPVDTACEYSGLHKCILCGAQPRHCFTLGIGADLIVECDECNTANAIDVAERDDISCSQCGAAISFLPNCEEDELEICHPCLRAGKAAFTKDTTLGMVRWEDANRGMTHGRPGKIVTDFELGPTSADGWTGVKVPPDLLFELVRTPTYSTIQGEQWQFCCQRPMIYLGQWDRAEFDRQAVGGQGRELFEQIVQDITPGLWEDNLHDETGIYVFKCGNCNRMTAHWDLA